MVEEYKDQKFLLWSILTLGKNHFLLLNINILEVAMFFEVVQYLKSDLVCVQRNFMDNLFKVVEGHLLASLWCSLPVFLLGHLV